MTIIPVTTADEVLHHALVSALVPIEWKEEEQAIKATPVAGGEDDEVIRH